MGPMRYGSAAALDPPAVLDRQAILEEGAPRHRPVRSLSGGIEAGVAGLPVREVAVIVVLAEKLLDPPPGRSQQAEDALAPGGRGVERGRRTVRPYRGGGPCGARRGGGHRHYSE